MNKTQICTSHHPSVHPRILPGGQTDRAVAACAEADINPDVLLGVLLGAFAWLLAGAGLVWWMTGGGVP
jgi:hypothetical protein